MSPTDFIYVNIKNILIKKDYPEFIASSAVNQGVEEYKRRSCATQKGKIFDDCLNYATDYAKKLKKTVH